MATQTPALLVCLAACLVVVVRWREVSPAGPWALFGFGLNLVLLLVVPVWQVLVQRWAAEHMVSLAKMGTVFGVSAVVWSVLHALAFGALLAAVLLRRGSPSATPPPPLPPDVRVL